MLLLSVAGTVAKTQISPLSFRGDGSACIARAQNVELRHGSRCHRCCCCRCLARASTKLAWAGWSFRLIYTGRFVHDMEFWYVYGATPPQLAHRSFCSGRMRYCALALSPQPCSDACNRYDAHALFFSLSLTLVPFDARANDHSITGDVSMCTPQRGIFCSIWENKNERAWEAAHRAELTGSRAFDVWGIVFVEHACLFCFFFQASCRAQSVNLQKGYAILKYSVRIRRFTSERAFFVLCNNVIPGTRERDWEWESEREFRKSERSSIRAPRKLNLGCGLPALQAA